MKAKDKPATTPAAAAPVKTPGRPPKGSQAMTGAERQAALRRRQREAAMTAYGHPQGQPTPAILAALGRLLVKLDDPEQASGHATLRDMASGTVRELVTRYKLKVSSR
jgi:hypothetical protein